MNYFKIIFYILLIKILYDLSYWIYGYFLRYKWSAVFYSNNKNLLSYYYQILEYLNKLPYESVNPDIYRLDNKPYIEILFIKSHGYYRQKFLQNFNPFYWINVIIFLPQRIIYYLGINYKMKTIHLLNLIYWICSIIFTIYNDEIVTYIKDLIDLIFKYFTKEWFYFIISFFYWFILLF